MGWRSALAGSALLFSLVNNRSFNWGVVPVNVSVLTSHFCMVPGERGAWTQPQAHPSWGNAERVS